MVDNIGTVLSLSKHFNISKLRTEGRVRSLLTPLTSQETLLHDLGITNLQKYVFARMYAFDDIAEQFETEAIDNFEEFCSTSLVKLLREMPDEIFNLPRFAISWRSQSENELTTQLAIFAEENEILKRERTRLEEELVVVSATLAAIQAESREESHKLRTENSRLEEILNTVQNKLGWVSSELENEKKRNGIGQLNGVSM